MADKVLPEAGWFENFAIALNSFNLTESVAGQVAKLGEIDNPATKLIHTAITQEPVIQVAQTAAGLLSKYSQFVIPLIGITVQLTISSYTRKWADERAIKEKKKREEAAAKNGTAATAPTGSSTATATAPAASTTKKGKGKK